MQMINLEFGPGSQGDDTEGAGAELALRGGRVLRCQQAGDEAQELQEPLVHP